MTPAQIELAEKVEATPVPLSTVKVGDIYWHPVDDESLYMVQVIAITHHFQTQQISITGALCKAYIGDLDEIVWVTRASSEREKPASLLSDERPDGR